MSRRTCLKLTWGCHSTTNNPVGFLLWRLVHRCISIFYHSGRREHTQTFGHHALYGGICQSAPMSLYHTVYLLSLLARLFQTSLPYPHSTEVESPCQPNACRDTFLRENTGA